MFSTQNIFFEPKKSSWWFQSKISRGIWNARTNNKNYVRECMCVGVCVYVSQCTFFFNIVLYQSHKLNQIRSFDFFFNCSYGFWEITIFRRLVVCERHDSLLLLRKFFIKTTVYSMKKTSVTWIRYNWRK